MYHSALREYNLILLFSILHILCIKNTLQTVHGRYTRDIIDYDLSVPKRVSSTGQLISFKLPQYFDHKYEERFKREATPASEKLYYNIPFEDKDHHVELWPNHGFVSPDLVKEVYGGDNVPVAKRKLNRAGRKLCYYVGRVIGDENSRVALALCDGVAGYLMTDKGQYFIEPVAEHRPNRNGEHVHVIYKRELQSAVEPQPSGPKCGTKGSWVDSWTAELKRKRSKGSVGSHSSHRYLEVLVVADKKFTTFHKDVDVETYIMTIMNMVSNYYHDASVGNQIDVAVVRQIFLEKDEDYVGLMINQNAEDTLASFCKWQTTINPSDIKNPQHHDISVLLTRYDLCSDNVTDCNLMGLAYVGTACNPAKSCSINEDSGLGLGITVTHEMGHVLGCGHDNGEDSPCKAETGDGNYYVMSPYAHMATTLWSPCSKKFITQLFENALGECLNDVPEESLYQESDMPPGSVYDADYQCNIDFPGSTKCNIETIKMCETLYCKKGPSCSSRGEPPADGTKCGENMWCYNGECVEVGQRPKAIDGGWGSWGSWSACTRPCGGGVSISERDCNNPAPQHRGRYCIGERKKVKLCNTNLCAEGAPSFRAQQCQEFNSKPFKGKLYSWAPYVQKEEPCKLHCINDDRFFVELSPRVKDGTSCKPGARDKCIFGVCRKVGCDNEIDSTAIEDQCGVCNGDGSQCRIVEGTFEKTGNGYVKIIEIPANSRNILISEKRASQNTIAISAPDLKKFYLNGNFSEEYNGDYDFGGVSGVYDHPSEDKETLFIAGPLKKPIVLHEVFYSHDNPGINYKFAEPGSTSIKGVFNWDFLEFGPCSSKCGTGFKISFPQCVEKKQGRVGNKFCEKMPKPAEKTLECNERPCKMRWRTGPWSKCSGCKFKSGNKKRTVECVREAKQSGRDPVVVEDSNCVEKRPASRELCCTSEPCPKKRRMTDELIDKLSGLWYQINRDALENGKLLLTKRNTIVGMVDNNDDEHLIERSAILNPKNNKKRGGNECTTQIPKVVKDHIPADSIKLIEVPIKEQSSDIRLSDAAYETAGDKTVDTLDFCHETIYTGKEALEAIKAIKEESQNTTAATSK